MQGFFYKVDFFFEERATEILSPRQSFSSSVTLCHFFVQARKKSPIKIVCAMANSDENESALSHSM